MTTRTIEPAPRNAASGRGVLYLAAVFTALGIAGFALGALFMLARLLSPALLAAGIAAFRALPSVALVLLAMSLASLSSFGITAGFWLLVEGVRKRP